MQFHHSSIHSSREMRAAPPVGKQLLRALCIPTAACFPRAACFPTAAWFRAARAVVLGVPALVASVACGPAEPVTDTNSSSAEPALVMPTASATAPEMMAAVPSATAPVSSTPPPVAVDPGGGFLGQDEDPLVTEMTPQECASADTPASLSKVVLAFVFDVSASMGSEYEPFHSRALKWDPVVAATKAFFSDPASKGLSATLTFFPNEYAVLTDTLGQMGAPPDPTDPTDPTAMPADPVPANPGMPAPAPADTAAPDPAFPMMLPPIGGGTGTPAEVCQAVEYENPDVPLTDLPSDAFATAIDAITPPDELTWRLSTPTLPALEGTITYLQTLQAQDPTASYTIVLVTDGMPALCVTTNDDIDPVIDAVGTVSDTIPTYVIGVENPITEEEPNPPPSVDGMHAVAEAGGTGEAFVIDTTDPTKTATDLSAIIDQIRDSSFTCSLGIPPPPDGLDFNKEQINVQFTTATGAAPYDYDPECAGATGWRFDNEDMPTAIELCPSACDALLAGLDVEGGELNVQFGCERRTAGSR